MQASRDSGAAAFRAPSAFGRERIEQILPHGEQALLLERVAWFEPGREAVATLRPLGDEPLAVPRSGDGTIPSVLFVEAVAQLAGILIASVTERPEGPTPAWLAGLRRFEFPAPARPGEPLTVCVRLGRRIGRLVHAHGEVFAGAAVCARGTVMVAVARPDGGV